MIDDYRGHTHTLKLNNTYQTVPHNDALSAIKDFRQELYTYYTQPRYIPDSQHPRRHTDVELLLITIDEIAHKLTERYR